MKTALSRLPFKTFFILLTCCFYALRVSAQSEPELIEGHWIGQGYQLYLQKGLFLLQSEGNTAFSGVYHTENGYLLLEGNKEKQVYTFKKKGNSLCLLGAEREINLQADKHGVRRNIFMGSISQISPATQQNESSSQLPEYYYN